MLATPEPTQNAQPKRRLLERLLRWRDDMLASPRVQALTVAVPFLRPVANRRARALFDLCVGFVHTQVVTACIELDLLEILAQGPMALHEIAERTDLTADACERLLLAATALKLLVRMRDGRFRLGELGAALRGATGVTDMIRHNQVFYHDLQDPVGLLRSQGAGSQLGSYWPYAEGGTDVRMLPAAATSRYSALMSATQPLIAADVLAAYDFSRHRALLDVGGGHGTFAAAVAQRHPALAVGVFDLPSVAEAAERALALAGLGGRSTTHGGDFHAEPLPHGYDAISLVRILLDHDDEAVLALLRRARAALPDGGRLLVAEIMSEAPGAETISDAYFGLYLLAMGRGRPRTAAAIARLLDGAGFTDVRTIKTRRSLMTQLIVASR